MGYRGLKRIAAITMCVSMSVPAMGLSAFGAERKFSDITGHWAEKAIQKMVEKDVISGYEDNTFRADNSITKAEFVTIINNLFSFTDDSAQQFDDVAEDAWYAKQMKIARKAGYFSGIGNNMAEPNANITRQEAFAIIARLYNFEEKAELDFADANEISDYAKEAFAELKAAGIINGYEDGTIRPKAMLTRGETAMLLLKSDEKASGDNSSSETGEKEPEQKPTDKNTQVIEGHHGGGGGGSSSGSTNNVAAVLTGLEIEDTSSANADDESTETEGFEIFDAGSFDKNTLNYTVKVQSDIYGVLIKPKYDKSKVSIKVTADHDAFAYGGKTQNYKAGDEISYNETFGGYIVELDQTYEGYDSEFIQNVTVEVTDKNGKKTTYTVKIERECDEDIVKLFGDEQTFEATDGTELKYHIYYPPNYETSNKEYPIVLSLHGAGQRASTGQTSDMTLKRYQAATIWAKDSEVNEDKECIVISPQATNMWANGKELSADGKAAYELLENVISTEKVDEDRVYLTGLSMGGCGTWTMAQTHPETFAAIMPVCGWVGSPSADSTDKGDDYDWSAYKNNLDGKIWLFHAETDGQLPGTVSYTNFTNIRKHLDAAGIRYNHTSYPADEFVYPNGHFSWTAAYANKTARNWLFQQTRTASAKLSGLDVNDITEVEGKKNVEDNYHINIFDENTFDETKNSYEVTVQSDIYGVLVKPTVEEGTTIKSVTADTTVKNYKNAETYTSGREIAYNETLGGYIIPLDQTYEGYDSEFVQAVTIVVGKEGVADKKYTVKITRESDKAVYDAFEQDTFKDSKNYEINYNIYYPEGYKTSGKQYPVVLALHGYGQSSGNASPDNQPVDMVLKRYQLASIWAKDSMENHAKDCIVIAPQVDLDKSSGWAKKGDESVLDSAGEAAYELLQSKIKEGHIDASRVYVVGASMGGEGTWCMLNAHPETFAAAIACCGKTDINKYNWEQFKNNFDGKIYFMHSEDDSSTVGGVNYSEYTAIKSKLDENNINYNTAVYPANSIFYPTPHFSWTPAFADKEIRNWLFEQSKTSTDAELVSLTMEDSTTKTIFDSSTFAQNTLNYNVNVQSDILGVLIKPEVKAGSKITSVKVNKTPGDYGKPDTDSEKELTFNSQYGGYVIPLSGNENSYNSEYDITATVTVAATEGDATKSYTVNVSRAATRTDLFQEKTFTTSSGGSYEYNIYVPDGLQAGDNVPVILALHGGGQFSQTADMVLKRYKMATIWAEESEADPNKKCIVIAPKGNKDVASGWGTDNGNGQYVPTKNGEAAYEILQSVLREYSNIVDTDRVYCTGLSAGEIGTWAVTLAHPETFAAIMVSSGNLAGNEDIVEIKDIPMLIAHAEDDPVAIFSRYEEQTLPVLARYNVQPEKRIYPSGTFFHTTPHFAWTAMYADETARQWLFAQRKAEQTADLTSLSVIDSLSGANKINFNADTKTYDITVQSDTYGVLVKPEAGENAEITVYATTTPGNYGGEDSDDLMTIEKQKYNLNSSDGKTYEGYVVPLSQTYESYLAENQYKQKAYIVVKDTTTNAEKVYTLNITRTSDDDLVKLFKKGEFTYTTTEEKYLDRAVAVGEYDEKPDSLSVTIPYYVYAPSDMEEGEKLPVILALHGAGQRTPQDAEMVLRRYRMGLEFAEESEEGNHRCIVIVPQCATTLDDDGKPLYDWGLPDQIEEGKLVPSVYLEGAYSLLQKIKSDYSAHIDTNKIYCTGMSMGGMGTLALGLEHPEEWAAIMPCVGFKVGSKDYFNELKDNGVAVRLGVSVADSTYSNYADITARLTAAGIDYSQVIYGGDTFLWTTPHFAWIPFYGDSETMTWLFGQRRTTSAPVTQLLNIIEPTQENIDAVVSEEINEEVVETPEENKDEYSTEQEETDENNAEEETSSEVSETVDEFSNDNSENQTNGTSEEIQE